MELTLGPFSADQVLGTDGLLFLCITSLKEDFGHHALLILGEANQLRTSLDDDVVLRKMATQDLFGMELSNNPGSPL